MSGKTTQDGTMLLEGLIDLYGRERVLYQEVLQLSNDQADLVRAGESLRRVRQVLDAKRERLDEIARLERESATARSYWERHRYELGGSHPVRLQQSLHAVGELIEKILQVESENDKLFLEMAGHAV
jgi:hypothetical protein